MDNTFFDYFLRSVGGASILFGIAAFLFKNMLMEKLKGAISKSNQIEIAKINSQLNKINDSIMGSMGYAASSSLEMQKASVELRLKSIQELWSKLNSLRMEDFNEIFAHIDRIGPDEYPSRKDLPRQLELAIERHDFTHTKGLILSNYIRPIEEISPFIDPTIHTKYRAICHLRLHVMLDVLSKSKREHWSRSDRVKFLLENAFEKDFSDLIFKNHEIGLVGTFSLLEENVKYGIYSTISGSSLIKEFSSHFDNVYSSKNWNDLLSEDSIHH